MNSNGLRKQQTWAGDALSPRPMYDFPSPTSNYPSGIGASSPSFYPMAYQISPRFGASAFIPPPDVFGDGRNDDVARNGPRTPRGPRKRSSEVLNTDPVAMHLLVETAMADSRNFDVLTVEEVDALKQEQKTLDARLATVRKKLESETKIRDATRSLSRLASRKENGHTRGLGSKGSNTVLAYDAKSNEGLEASNRKVEEFIRELLETESRMRMIDMQLLMHTSAVLQLTHKGPKKRNDSSSMSDDGYRRPDSPASLETYDIGRGNGARGDDYFDERSFYRSPENLDTLMNALQSGIFQKSEPDERHSETISTTAKRLEEMNEKLRTLLAQAHPERAADFALSRTAPNERPDAAAIDRQLEFLDEGLRSISAEQSNARGKSRHSLSEVEGRLEGINNQLYAVLSRSSNDGTENTAPPPPVTGGDPTEQLNYMEDSFYNLEQIQYSLNEQVDNLKFQVQNNEKAELSDKYETTLLGLWQLIQAGEEEARERKRERRRLLAEDPDADEQLSPDEDYNANESYSLPAFSSKVQWLFRRATSLKDKQSVLMRQIKQQRELNSKSDAQKEADFERLNQQVLSARSEKKSMEDELERAIGQLEQFDEQKVQGDAQALQERNAGLEAQLINVQERAVAFETDLRSAKERATAYESQLKDVQERAVAFQTQLRDAEKRTEALQKQLDDNKEHHSASSTQAREAGERSAGYEAQIRDAQQRAIALESQLREAQDEARAESSTIRAELAESAIKIDGIMTALKQATMEKEAAEARSLETTNNLNAKEDDFRNLEGEIVRLTTELTFAKAELDGAYGTRAQRAADSAANPAIKKELDELTDKNQAIMDELTALRKLQDAASQSEAEARQSERNLKAELSGMASEYEALTRDAIQNEKDRDILESQIDKLRDDKEALERELSDEKVKYLGVRSPGMPSPASGQLDMGATSIRMLREDFRKMMRDRTAEGLKALRAEQEERRRLEALVRQMRKDANPRSNLSKTTVAQ
ncbi:Up-regulated during septation-domain-containing protein [Phaeosphaeria sp. MPI-PUGE-AT-0046c]|nr:Up-regulated during septation-domain-containing protein [Phaeosphaeria sp. MPI-PUGE-AT-0046c]